MHILYENISWQLVTENAIKKIPEGKRKFYADEVQRQKKSDTRSGGIS
jgi:hypothetical protein